MKSFKKYFVFRISVVNHLILSAVTNLSLNELVMIKNGERGERRGKTKEKEYQTGMQYRHYLLFKKMKDRKDLRSPCPSGNIYDGSILSNTTERIHVKTE